MKSFTQDKNDLLKYSFSSLIKRKAIFAFSLSDIICLFISGIFTNFIYQAYLIKFTEIIILLFFWLAFSYIFGRYSTKRRNFIRGDRLNLFLQQFQYILVFYIISWLINNRISANYYFSYDTNFIYILTFFITNLTLFRIVKYKLLKNLRNNNKWGFYGPIDDFRLLNNLINKKYIEYDFVIDKINFKEIINNNYSGIILSKEFIDKESEEYLLLNILNKSIAVYFLDDWLETRLNRIPFEYINIENLFKNFNRIKSNKLQIRLKRLGDVSLSILLLVLTFPFLFISSIFIWLSDQGPIFYTQKRVGKDGKEFSLYKLRTMIVNAEKGRPEWASKKDHRITFIGKFLRKTRLDEIPQLICVLNGDMSLIGPRPERPEIEVDLKSQIYNYELRHLVKPGLSGWAQVNSNYAASLEGVKLKLSYDLYYISNQSIWIDLLILIKTIKVVFNCQGSEPLE